MADPVSSNRAELAEHSYKQVNSGATANTIVADTVLAVSEGIDYRRYASGHFTVVGASTTTLTWYSSMTDTPAANTGYVAAYTEANVAVTQTVAASRRYPIPAALAGAHFIRAVANVAGTLTSVCLKF